ncbi:MAG: Rne/Rng family ribonuclease, partial [Candidatus Nanopelagicales bacterium]|nr:Rne/Rng family ribonuclease [Candidatus Nanopelagicales bacterium]MCF8537736.1 Rne/Rng family ribonuclease [Candidatus Nanopelagicales bacterium]MCF8542532.1 Rne/Rng family ribonuclease [Candidatus Nanopelagicales bacterium]
MVDEMNTQDPGTADTAPAVAKRTRRRAASRPAGPPVDVVDSPVAQGDAPAEEKPKKKAAARKVTKKATAKAAPAGKAETADKAEAAADQADAAGDQAAEEKPKRKTTRKSTKKAPAKATADAATGDAASDGADTRMASPAFVAPLFQAPEPGAPELGAPEPEAPAAKAPRGAKSRGRSSEADDSEGEASEAVGDSAGDSAGDEENEDGTRRRRRRRGGRRRRKSGDEDDAESSETSDDADSDDAESPEGSEDGESEDGGRRRRRRRRRRGSGDDADGSPDDPPNTVTRVREPRSKGGDDVTSLKGSTRLEAKKQRRREGREAGRRRAPILTESEFLARREAVERVMAVREQGERTQIAVLEDGVLVEHYVTRGTSGSMVGNVYLGRVQNVLPSMEAAFIDIGRGRNAVLYAGEVNWDAAGLDGQPKRIEFALKSGDPVLVQVTKDPVGQKGARLTSQVSLPGRFLVYVPDGSMTGISRKLPDTERSRLKKILKRVMPDDAGVIVRTAAEGAPEEALEADVERLKAQWETISAAAKTANPPTLLYSEPDLAIKVVRDIFNEDVASLMVSGDTVWTALNDYIGAVAPDLAERLKHWVEPKDIFTEYRVDEQLMKALDRKVYLPSGGSLVIDRTEAMTVVDVNTGKFTGQGGNLEQTVTRNNLEAAEEIVRQLRLRDIGGIIVVDFIDMVLESNRDLVLRRLVECLGRDRTKHQVAEVTSLGLVQMTRKRIGSGLLESFSETCDHCSGRGVRITLNAEHHHESPKGRKPAGFVDPAEAAARALAGAPAADASSDEVDV